MDNVFLTKVVLSFVAAGAWIALGTVLSERLGSRVGGLIANLPSNLLISLIFVASANGVDYVVAMIPSIPIGMSIAILFLLMFMFALKWGITSAVVCSLTFWLALATIAAFVQSSDLLVNISIFIVINVVILSFLEKVLKVDSSVRAIGRFSFKELVIRTVLAGSIVASVVILSRFLNPVVVGVFATFPAVYLSTMLILARKQDERFVRAVGKVLILSSSNIVVYCLMAAATFPAYGVAIGTIISFAASFIWIWLFYPVLLRLR